MHGDGLPAQVGLEHLPTAGGVETWTQSEDEKEKELEPEWLGGRGGAQTCQVGLCTHQGTINICTANKDLKRKQSETFKSKTKQFI